MSIETTGRPIEILLVEDNPGDIRLTVEALREAKVRNNLHVVEDFWLTIVKLPSE